MGFFSILSLAIGAFSAVSQRKAQKKAQKARREGQAVSNAGQEIQNRLARREEAKRLRIQRARIAASAEASGVQGSSGELGALSASTAASSASVAGQQSQVLVAQGISAASNKEADAISKGKSTQAFLGLLSEGLNLANDEGLFD